MAKYEGLSVLLSSIIAVATVFVLVLSFVPFPFKYPVLLLSGVIFVVCILWYFYSYSRRREEQNGASLKISILPFYKGSFKPPSPGVKTVNPDGTTTYTAKNDVQATSSQVKYLERSQIFAVSGGVVGGKMSEFVAKFGVLRFELLSGSVKGCHVGAKYLVVKEMNDARVFGWHDGGYLNWYSIMVRQKLLKCNVFEKIFTGINECLKNDTTDIYQGEERDLLLFYVVKGSPMVHLCSTLDSCVIGYAPDEDVPLVFELKLTVVGEGLLTVEKTFKVSAVWDDFKIEEVAH